ncbi:unnamed protein product [Ilex paraguariensis]|uniref:Uncharacterized protein n=1 Tax=Ilex paraguariensis TaxID=185542 RepID=A0ABC8UQP8_9AQUA
MYNRARNFRRRSDDTDEDNDNTTTTSTSTNKPQSKPSTKTAASKPKKPPSQAPKNLLSFADDEETESSPITRPSSKPSSSSSRFAKSVSSSSSHKLTAAKDRIAPSSSSLPSNVQPQAGTYTKEALLELQKNTRTLASSRPPPKPASEPVIVLKGLVKPATEKDQDGEKVEIIQDLEDDEVGIERKEGLSGREKDDAITRLGSMGLGKGEDLILDQATIAAIRAKRERLRQSRAAAPDFIALDGGSNHGEREGLSDEEPEFQMRIGFFGEKIDSGKKGVGVFEDVDERAVAMAMAMDGGFRKDGEVDSGDEEDKIWEEEQFRKGLGKRMDDGSSRGVSSSVDVVQSQIVQQQKLGYSTGVAAYSSVPNAAAVPSIGGAVGAMPNLDVISIPQQAEIAKKAMLENVRRLKESHGRTMASLTRTDENLSASLLNVTTLENSLSAAERRRELKIALPKIVQRLDYQGKGKKKIGVSMDSVTKSFKHFKNDVKIEQKVFLVEVDEKSKGDKINSTKIARYASFSLAIGLRGVI